MGFNRHIIQIFVGQLSSQYESLSIEVSKETSSLEIVSCIVERLGLHDSNAFELSEVVGYSNGQDFKERSLLSHETPVQLQKLWPQSSQENRDQQEYRFCLRKKSSSDSFWSDPSQLNSQLIKDYFYKFLYQPKDKEYPDLCQLTNLNEQSLLENLKARFRRGHIYTYVGSILISVNPFKFFPIYNPKYVKLYQNHRLGELPPHIFAIADVAYHSMLKQRKHQCVVISGESGSGKTEATSCLLHHLTMLSQKGSHGSGVEQIILSSSPVLEAFGNAKTAHNNNSSRFGKFIQVFYKENGLVQGACVQKYLLEKSRICSQAPNERSYHVFYYLLAGVDSPQERQALNLLKPSDYRYLNQSLCYTIDGCDEQYEFVRLKKSMEMVGFTSDKINRLFSVLSAVLLLGNIEFIPRKSSYSHDESVVVKNWNIARVIANLLGVSEDTLASALISKKANVHGETLVITYRLAEALAARDALAKGLYSALFDWIVLQVNYSLISLKETTSEHSNSIGVLDIFGFEDFGYHNRFEQFCINYANEHLQHYFNQHVFEYEQEEYARENISWKSITFTDNVACLALIESKPHGLLCILDDQCSFPAATNETFLDKINSVHKSNNYYEIPQKREGAFIIKHYAGKVKYKVDGMKEKNLDLMRPELISVLKNSRFNIVRELAGADPVAVFRWAILRAFFRAISAFQVDKTKRKAIPEHRKSKPKISVDNSKILTAIENQNRLRRSRHSRSRSRSQISRSQKNLKSVKALVIRTQNLNYTQTYGRTTGSRKSINTVTGQFQASLQSLMITLNRANPYFIRCIKSNASKEPNSFNDELVQRQLRYTGMLDTVRIRQAGFNVRMNFEEFIQHYRILLPKGLLSSRSDVRDFLLLQQLDRSEYQIGRTKIFMRESQKQKLDTQLHQTILSRIVIIQRWYRARYQRCTFVRMRLAVIKIQAQVRCWLAQQVANNLRMQHQAATCIQRIWRGYKVRSWFMHIRTMFIRLQARIRGKKARKLFYEILNQSRNSVHSMQPLLGFNSRDSLERNIQDFTEIEKLRDASENNIEESTENVEISPEILFRKNSRSISVDAKKRSAIFDDPRSVSAVDFDEPNQTFSDLKKLENTENSNLSEKHRNLSKINHDLSKYNHNLSEELLEKTRNSSEKYEKLPEKNKNLSEYDHKFDEDTKLPDGMSIDDLISGISATPIVVDTQVAPPRRKSGSLKRSSEPVNKGAKPTQYRDRPSTSPTDIKSVILPTNNRNMKPRHDDEAASTKLRHGDELRSTKPRHDDELRSTKPRHDEEAASTKPRQGDELRSTKPRHDEEAASTKPRHGDELRSTKSRPNEKLHDAESIRVGLNECFDYNRRSSETSYLIRSRLQCNNDEVSQANNFSSRRRESDPIFCVTDTPVGGGKRPVKTSFRHRQYQKLDGFEPRIDLDRVRISVASSEKIANQNEVFVSKTNQNESSKFPMTSIEKLSNQKESNELSRKNDQFRSNMDEKLENSGCENFYLESRTPTTTQLLNTFQKSSQTHASGKENESQENFSSKSTHQPHSKALSYQFNESDAPISLRHNFNTASPKLTEDVPKFPSESNKKYIPPRQPISRPDIGQSSKLNDSSAIAGFLKDSERQYSFNYPESQSQYKENLQPFKPKTVESFESPDRLMSPKETSPRFQDFRKFKDSDDRFGSLKLRPKDRSPGISLIPDTGLKGDDLKKILLESPHLLKHSQLRKGEICSACLKPFTKFFANPGFKCTNCRKIFHSSCVKTSINMSCLFVPGEKHQNLPSAVVSKDLNLSTITQSGSKKPKRSEDSSWKITGTSQFKDKSDEVIKDSAELKCLEEFITNKIYKLQSSAKDEFDQANIYGVGGGIHETPVFQKERKDSQVDELFVKSLKAFKRYLVSAYSLACQSDSDDIVKLKYKDLTNNFEREMNLLCRKSSRDAAFPVTMGVNAFRGFLDEFIRDKPKVQCEKVNKKRKRSRRKKKDKKSEEISVGSHRFNNIFVNIYTQCEVCSSILWLSSKALTCQRCKFTCHQKCIDKVTPNCSSNPNAVVIIENRPRRDTAFSKSVALPLVTSTKLGKVFGIPLDQLVGPEEKIPAVIERIITSIELYGIYTEGLYRKSGTTSKLKEVRNRIDSDPESVIFDDTPIHVMTSILKSFLRDLPEPLLTYDAYDPLLRASALKDSDEMFQTTLRIVHQLPKINFDLLERLIFHLAHVAQYEQYNRMNCNSLAIVFTPCILRNSHSVPVQDSLNDISKQTQAIELLISKQLSKVYEVLKIIESVDLESVTANQKLNSLRSSARLRGRANSLNPQYNTQSSSPPTADTSHTGAIAKLGPREALAVYKLEEQLSNFEEQKDRLTMGLTELVRVSSEEDLLTTDPSRAGSFEDLSTSNSSVSRSVASTPTVPLIDTDFKKRKTGIRHIKSSDVPIRDKKNDDTVMV